MRLPGMDSAVVAHLIVCQTVKGTASRIRCRVIACASAVEGQ
jgi:hypothetical protein